MQRSTLLHLRIPFSFFLLPVFLFAWSINPSVAVYNFLAVGFILHFLVYPASNGYNSYFDKDEDSIGGLKNPPKVDRELYDYSLFLDGVALVWSGFINPYFAVCVLVYGLISKAYSHPAIRLKKMPYIGWVAAGFFQGYFTFLMVYLGLHDVGLDALWQFSIQFPAVLCTCLLFGSYPMTQIYQHAEDARRGDLTISRKLGILGTFHFTAAAFTFSASGFFYFYFVSSGLALALTFFLALSPTLIFFLVWYIGTRKNSKEANFKNTMRLNQLSSLCLNLFFLYTGFMNA